MALVWLTGLMFVGSCSAKGMGVRSFVRGVSTNALNRRSTLTRMAGVVGTVAGGAVACASSATGSTAAVSMESNPRMYFAQEPDMKTVKRCNPMDPKDRSDLISHIKFPETTPFVSADFKRYDETPDSMFYVAPRFVTHIDDKAIEALTKYYSASFPTGKDSDVAILDICSSWISHYPKDFKPAKAIGLGMNAAELKENKQLTSYVVQDLNKEAKLPFEDNTFDYITNVVSVDYLSQPVEIFKELHRVLKPGGKMINTFSNRCFPTKAIDLWLQTQDWTHLLIVAEYFKLAGFENPAAFDITLPDGHDPMYVVEATKK